MYITDVLFYDLRKDSHMLHVLDADDEWRNQTTRNENLKITKNLAPLDEVVSERIEDVRLLIQWDFGQHER